VKSVPVSVAGDLTYGFGMHLDFPPDVVEEVAVMAWAPGAAMGKHSMASTVLHKGQPIVTDGHDLGPGLTHSVLNHFMHALKSNRKTVYAASTVVAKGKPVACVDTSQDLKMIVCGDPIALPNGRNLSNVMHTVFVGMTELDEFKGDVAIACSCATDYLNFVVACASMGASELPKSFSEVFGNATKDALGLDPVKAAIGAGVNLVGSVAISYKSGWKEPITFKAEIGGGLVSGSTEASWSPETEAVTEKTVINAFGLKVEQQISGAKHTVSSSAFGSDPKSCEFDLRYAQPVAPSPWGLLL
jgi:hypothetical protein